MSDEPLVLGAVGYDPKVITIWDGFQRYFAERGLPLHYILFTNYKRHVQAHFAGQIHVAWNSPLTWLESECIAASLGRRAEAICMGDTDRDLTSVVVTRNESRVRTIADLKGRRVAVGAKDSPQATLIPLYFLAEQGLEPNSDFEVVLFDKLKRETRGSHWRGARRVPGATTRGL